jgi:hypothetical protein
LAAQIDKLNLLKQVKNIIIQIDNQIMSPIQKILYRARYFRSRRNHEKHFKRKFSVYESNSKINLFALLCDSYGSDKGTNEAFNNKHPWPSHTYSDFMIFTFLNL